MADGYGKSGLGEVFRRVSHLIPSNAVKLAEIPFCMAVGTGFGPKDIVVAFAFVLNPLGISRG